MTKIEKIFEKERIEYGNEQAKKAANKTKMEYIKGMLDKGIDIVDIMEITGLTEQEILSFKDDKVLV